MAKYQLTIFSTIDKITYTNIFIEALNNESLNRKIKETLQNLEIPNKKYLYAQQIADYCVKHQDMDVSILRSEDKIYARLKYVFHFL